LGSGNPETAELDGKCGSSGGGNDKVSTVDFGMQHIVLVCHDFPPVSG